MNLSLLIIIDSKQNEKNHLKRFHKFNVPFRAILYGKGTASSSLLEYFGIDETEKIVILTIVPKIMSKYILKDIQKALNIEDPGNGIAFTIPLSSSTKYIQDFYQNKNWEDFEMEEMMKHLIITITNEGFAETVMTAAKKAGATGGTTINGRGLETEKIVKFLGVSIEPEKDIILILTDEEKKNPIMNEIVKACGLKTPGAGICFSLPVDNAIGLIEEKKN